MSTKKAPSLSRKKASSRSLSRPPRPAREEIIELVPMRLRLKTILVPTDFSTESLRALRYAIPFADQFGAKLVLLHVVEPMPFADLAAFPLMMESGKVVEACKKKLQALAARRGVPAEVVSRIVVRQGQPFQEICDAARTLKADLILISTHGYTGVKHVLLGSTAERVAQHAPCPVLVVRDHERDFV